ncbi:MAG: TIGR04283 family arsenosugar biosynthesis glycosyltransferase [Alphaproteobacteria bacterium]|jgi:rSAM/selenodomain-associated transferase 2
MISIIIPTFNEAVNLPLLLEAIAGPGVPREILVIDGGSSDGTAEIAIRAGVVCLGSAPGRGRQLVAGAAAAGGDILLFLHADSRFPAGGLERIEEILAASPDIVGGNFALTFDGGDGFSRWLNGFYGWLRRRGIYYGDSGIFVRRAVYDAIGGLRPIALMEDYDFARRLEAAGPTCCIDDPALVTSARRFAGRRPVAIVLGWMVIHALYHLGISPDRLARLYNSQRRPRERRGTAS